MVMAHFVSWHLMCYSVVLYSHAYLLTNCFTCFIYIYYFLFSCNNKLVNEFIICKWLGNRKTRGMGAGRKLKSHRRRQRWADKSYKKSHLGNEWKKPFAGSSHAKGIVLEKMLGRIFRCFFVWFALPLILSKYLK